jgi:hypothetical protein
MWDWDYATPVFQRYPQAKRYKDFRKMLEKQKDIGAVVVATPDHTHAIAAVAAMKAGKHVYVQKPLTHSVSEARLFTETARQTGIVTQMGNEGHSDDTVLLRLYKAEYWEILKRLMPGRTGQSGPRDWNGLKRLKKILLPNTLTGSLVLNQLILSIKST